MTNLLKPSLLAFALVIQTCNGVDPHSQSSPRPLAPHLPTPEEASEVDPGLALGGLTLLAGALTVVRSRKRR